MRRFVEGRYRTEASEHRAARAYVIDGAKAYFLTEEAYRSKGFRPPFETLPTEDQYHA
jgi:primosomal protein N'